MNDKNREERTTTLSAARAPGVRVYRFRSRLNEKCG
jgi:hypothetical protein